MTGVPEQVAALTRALGFAPAQFARQDRQPLYMIELSGVIMPMASKLALRSPVSEDQVWLAAWMSQNYADTGFPPPQGAKYTDLAADFIAKPDARLMCHEETPVAMSNFNARTHDMVQLGGVFVPPEHRGNGWGGAIVALHLAEARDTGIETAILFAASPFAARAYERIGFRRIGDYQIALLKAPCEVAA
jgi:predicted GNAT family acetyltransferase